MMHKKSPFLLLLLLIIFSGCSSLRLATNRHDVKMLRIAQQIRNHYVDVVDAQALTEAAIRAMVSQLDPYSDYFNAVQTRAARDAMRRNFFGIGADAVMIADTLHVTRILEDSPAQKAGLMWGDQIIYINNTLVAGVETPFLELVELLQGERGATVDLSVLRRNSPDLINLRIAFDRVSISSIDIAYMLTDDIGYIRLNRFSAATAREFREALRMLREQGMEHLVLDLMDNNGGLSSAMTSVAGEFLERGTRIGYREARRWIYRRARYRAGSGGEMLSGKVVVLVSEQTASASEILVGALQDWDRAVIVGRRTWGKALGQRRFSQGGDTSLNLTVTHFRTPSGRIIQIPFEENDMEAYRERVRNRIYHAEMFNVDSIQLSDLHRYTTLVNNRTVFGGGGILPDYFVVMDSLGIHLFRNLVEKGVIHSVVMSEVGDNRDELLYRYPDITAFQNNFQLPEDMTDRVRGLAKVREIEWCDEQFEGAYSRIVNRLKGVMALGLFGEQASIKILNESSPIFQEGLRIISDPERYENLLRGIGSNVGRR